MIAGIMVKVAIVVCVYLAFYRAHGFIEATVVCQSCRILPDGQEIACAVTISRYAHEEDAGQHKIAGAVPVQGFCRVWIPSNIQTRGVRHPAGFCPQRCGG